MLLWSAARVSLPYFPMTFEEKYLPGYIQLTDQISLSGWYHEILHPNILQYTMNFGNFYEK